MKLGHSAIAAYIPHADAMCLLEAVESWDSEHIVCRATSHRLPDNPLRADGSLGIATGIEYAAQAMAVHGALLSDAKHAPAAGFLASVRDVRWHRSRLDDVAGDLIIHAERISAMDSGILYSFAVSCDRATLISGRIAVIVDAGGT